MVLNRERGKKVLYIGSDHAGFDLKEMLKTWFSASCKRVMVKDMGNLTRDGNDDYPDFAAKVGRAVMRDQRSSSMGLLLCGSAEGMCMAANKIKGVRAVNSHSIIQTKLAREHEDANVLCLAGGKSLKPQPAVSFSLACKMVMVFLDTPFSFEKRHMRRIAKISRLEKGGT